MANEMTWTKIHDEREALLSDLETLTPEQWQIPSLCTGWTVQQVVAHQIGTATATKAGFVKGMLANRGNFEKMIAGAIAEYGSGSPEQTLATYRETMHNRTAPPGPVQSWLGEAVVHGEDIRRPLNITREYPAETLRTLGDFYKNSQMLIGSRKRIEGIHLMATDQEWSHGKGEIVEGPMLAILMTMTGRAAFLDDLSGDGLAAYRQRFDVKTA